MFCTWSHFAAWLFDITLVAWDEHCERGGTVTRLKRAIWKLVSTFMQIDQKLTRSLKHWCKRTQDVANMQTYQELDKPKNSLAIWRIEWVKKKLEDCEEVIIKDSHTSTLPIYHSPNCDNPPLFLFNKNGQQLWYQNHHHTCDPHPWAYEKIHSGWPIVGFIDIGNSWQNHHHTCCDPHTCAGAGRYHYHHHLRHHHHHNNMKIITTLVVTPTLVQGRVADKLSASREHFWWWWRWQCW